VLGTDYPFMPGDPVAHQDHSDLPPGLADGIRTAHPRRLLDLLARPGAA
jgi:hypothetical protein